MWLLRAAWVFGLAVVRRELTRTATGPGSSPTAPARGSRRPPRPRSSRFPGRARGGAPRTLAAPVRESELRSRWPASGGGEPSSRPRRALGWRLFWRVYERAYVWLHHLDDLAAGDRPYLRVGLARYRRRPVTLRDGTVLRRGDRILFLHFHNDSLARLGREAASPAKVGLAVRRVLEEGLAALAVRLATDPSLADVRAVGAVTNLWHGSQRVGFAVFPLRSRGWARLVAAYQRYLTRQHSVSTPPARPCAAGRGEARVIWVSATALIHRYGPGAAGDRSRDGRSGAARPRFVSRRR